MPIPFILGGIAVAAGLYGVSEGIDANDNMNKAKQLNRDAKAMAERTEVKIKRYKEDTTSALEGLGRTKISILSKSINDFVENFSKIKNVNITESVGLEELRGFNANSEEFLEMKDTSYKATELASGGAGSLAVGALAAYGATSAATAFGVASTGTAIAGLSGVAATNATLAWLGGGSLAAGGFGMAGGMAVLGGLVAGPALAVGGAFMAAKAKAALNDAKTNLDQARKFEQEGQNICSLLYAIEERAIQIGGLLRGLDERFVPAVASMVNIIEMAGTDWRDYRPKEKAVIGKAAQLAKTIKIVLDTSILREDGSLDPSSEEKLNEGNRFLEQFTG